MASWRSLIKIEGSGSISQCHGSADPDPHPKMSWTRNTASVACLLVPVWCLFCTQARRARSTRRCSCRACWAAWRAVSPRCARRPPTAAESLDSSAAQAMHREARLAATPHCTLPLSFVVSKFSYVQIGVDDRHGKHLQLFSGFRHIRPCCGSGSVGSGMFLDLPDPDPLVRDPDPSIINQK